MAKLNLKPEKGDFLISEPFLGDPNFSRSVVYLCEHDEDGSFGFVINRPSNLQINDILDYAHNCKELAYIGGPVEQNTLHFIFRGDYPIEGKLAISNNIFWSGDFEQVLSMLESRKMRSSDIRFFIGYSGWSAGQLENELKDESWMICKKPSPEMIFDYLADEQWRLILKQMGGVFKAISNYPTDPRLN
jgi:putative transcriptional regulator